MEYLRKVEEKRAPTSERSKGTTARKAKRKARTIERMTERERARKKEKVTEEKSPIELAEFYPKVGATSSSFSFSLLLFNFFNLSFYISPLCFLLHSFVNLLFSHLLSRPIVYLLLPFSSRYDNSSYYR